MHTKKIAKLRKQLEELRRKGGVRSRELESLAQALGRQQHWRGKEPTWVNPNLPGARPVSIPNHPGEMSRYTAKSILDQLEVDIDGHEEQTQDAEPTDEEAE